VALRRRDLLALAGLSSLACPAIAAARRSRFAAAWDGDEGTHIGVLHIGQAGLHVHSALPVPTRAHGLLGQADGSLVAASRRPGDWLVRWHPSARSATWAWAEPGRAFNGHAIASADRKHVYTTETDLETGQGLVGVRDAMSLQKLDEWATHGPDPHALVLAADGTLLVANGGIATLPESGRVKLHLERMDSSLVRLGLRGGALLGQWRVPDNRLSLRHLAWGRGILGIALQAEHADPDRKAAAPVLALFDGERLRRAAAPRPLAGYGGDIAFAQGMFIVSCPRSHGLALFGPDGEWRSFAELPSACGLANAGPATVWAAGTSHVQAAGTPPLRIPSRVRLDNHWLYLPG
jgi:hypothetical protein